MNPTATDPAALRKQAARYRDIASRLNDTAAIEALLTMATEYEHLAAQKADEAQQRPPQPSAEDLTVWGCWASVERAYRHDRVIEGMPSLGLTII